MYGIETKLTSENDDLKARVKALKDLAIDGNNFEMGFLWKENEQVNYWQFDDALISINMFKIAYYTHVYWG